MKNILILQGSPRIQGNSDILCDEFIKGAKEAGHKVEKIYVAEQEIAYCNGCGVCNKTGKCHIKDDMPKIAKKMLDSDVLVLSTPVYFYSMSAQLKTLIDRCASFYTQIKNKEVYFIITAADDNKTIMKKVIESLRGFTQDCLEGTQEKGIIYGLGMWSKGEIKDKTTILKKAYLMGKNC